MSEPGGGLDCSTHDRDDHIAGYARDMLGVNLSRENDRVVGGVPADADMIAAMPLHPDDIGNLEQPYAAGTGMAHAHATDPASTTSPGTTVGQLEAEIRKRASIGGRLSTSGFVEFEIDAALERAWAAHSAPGSLTGILYARKDCFERTGFLAECGSAVRAGVKATTSADVITTLDKHGAIDLGRLHMSEIALSALGRNDHLGPGRNPWDPSRISGGSSSGSAMAVAHGLVDLALGTDTGGSVRLPAAACGVTGLKPTNGSISSRGVMPLAMSLDVVGLVGSDIGLVQRAFSVLPRSGTGAAHGNTQAEGGINRVVLPRFTEGPYCTTWVRSAAEEVAGALETQGVQVIRSEVPDLSIVNRLAMTIMNVEGATSFLPELRRDIDLFSIEVRRRLERGLVTPAPVYGRSLQLRRPLLRAFLDEFLPPGAALILPSIPEEALPIDLSRSGTAGEIEAKFLAFSYWTRFANFFGLPAVSLPAGVGPAGLPLGIQIVGRPYADTEILDLGAKYQSLTSWHRRRASGSAGS